MKKSSSYVEPKNRKLIYKKKTKNPILLFWNWGFNIYYNNPEIWNYLIVGLLTTLVSIAIKFGLLFTVLDSTNNFELQCAVVISWIGAVAFAYITNRVFVFKSKSKKIFKEIVSFVGGRVFTLLSDMFIMWFFCTLLGLNTKLWVVIATTISQIFIIIANYIISKLFVFKKDGE